jgi:hypothetical protein
MPVRLVSQPNPELLGRLSRIKSFRSLNKAIQEWVPSDFTCVEGTSVEDMPFPPSCFESLSPADIEAVSDVLQIQSGSTHAFWAVHYFSINTLPIIPAKAARFQEAASELIDRIGSVELQDPNHSTFKDKNRRGLPMAPTILFATLAHASYRESRWRYELRADVVEDEEAYDRLLDHARQSQKDLFGLVMVAGEAGVKTNSPRDVVTTLSGRLSTWQRREEFLLLLDELGDLMQPPFDFRGQPVQTRATNKDEIVCKAWAGIRDLAKEAKTHTVARVVATELLAALDVRVIPNSAEKYLRRHCGGHPPQ